MWIRRVRYAIGNPITIRASDVAAITGFHKYRSSSSLLPFYTSHKFVPYPRSFLKDFWKTIRGMFSLSRRPTSKFVVGEPVVLFASDVSAASGYNQYKNQDDVIQQYASRQRRELLSDMDVNESIMKDIQELLEKSQTINSVESLRSAGDEAERLDLNVFSKEELDKVGQGDTSILDMKVESGKLTASARKEIILGKRSAESLNVDAETEIRIKKDIVSFMNTTFGTRHENRALELYEQKTGKFVVESNSKCYYIHYLRDNELLYSICGKIDGLSDGRLVEVKNRKNRFFGTRVPIYDRIQILTYLKMLELPAADLVECLMKKDGPEIMITEIHFDEDLWNDVTQRLEQFAIQVYTVRQALMS